MPALDHQLLDAQSQGCPRQAKALALPVLNAAIESGDRHLEARARACLAYCENLLSENRSAHATGAHAVQLFQAVGDTVEEAAALQTVSRAASALGRSEPAVEAALLAVELSRRGDFAERLAEAHIYLGMSLCFSKSFDAATTALEDAGQLSKHSSSPLNELHVLVSRGTCEVVRLITLRHESGQLPPLLPAMELLEEFAAFATSHDMQALACPDQMPLQMYWKLVSSVLNSWVGNIALAREESASVQRWATTTDASAWMLPFASLAQCELAQVEEDLHRAAQHAAAIVQLATLSEQEHYAILGHFLACRVFELQGKSSLALLELKQLAARERRIRSECLATRASVVGWQLEMRRSEESRRALKVSADHLEKLTLEDPLTGIANRRCFELEVARSLVDCRTTSQPTCVALLDVDSFKQVNDVHSHLVGDKVLQTIGALLTQHVREDDLAARLAGDEFVLLLRRTELLEAQQACERFRAAVEAYPWGGLSEGLRVEVSTGVAQAEQDETVEAVLNRSDAAMYAQKRREASTPGQTASIRH